MLTRRTAVLASVIVLSAAPAASAAQKVEPRAGVTLSGTLQFPRAQEMTLQTDPGDSRRLTAYVGFNGRCRGGGLSEIWAANIQARPIVRVKQDGRFSARVTGVARNIGGVAGRAGHFRWKLSGRFVGSDVATVTVSGDGDVRVRGRTVSRCKIAEPASARLAIRSR
jgi:hypothetical protein